MAAALGLARATDSLRMQKQFAQEAGRGIRSSARELSSQMNAYEQASGGSNREEAEETARKLLEELDEIERSLQEQEKLRKNGLA